ncbi:MAG: 4-hydroxythreonine-4-phosphate dehydrogenase PdxA [Kiritimatiellae bacterium]|nr:4-hydroxythreonine-4-phosphate dehydrogenase PdxA [Kiritimatiellia bacterium]
MSIAITMGDACGVGPELLLRAAVHRELQHDFIAIGDICVLEFAGEKLGLAADIRSIELGDEPAPGVLNVVDLGLLSPADITPGRISKAAGDAAVQYVELAAHAALDGKIDAIVTLPMNKESSGLTHPDFQGHTELIAGICGVDNFTMMLVTPKIIATHVSTHVSMQEAVRRVKKERILDVARLTNDAVKLIRPRARIAIAALNPHAGENGKFGNEDADEIAPAVAAARAEGIDAYGPIPADTLFMKALEGEYDAIVCMYHDQGHIPLKMISFHEGVNVTVGLPIIRTSVDHGTAFDIAYQGHASTQNLIAAFDLAATMAGVA